MYVAFCVVVFLFLNKSIMQDRNGSESLDLWHWIVVTIAPSSMKICSCIQYFFLEPVCVTQEEEFCNAPPIPLLGSEYDTTRINSYHSRKFTSTKTQED